jgi:hypothetical protein
VSTPLNRSDSPNLTFTLAPPKISERALFCRKFDEVAIKIDNNVSQNVDVIIGSSHVPYMGGRYTCRPASF